MGCYNGTCMVTHLPILYGDRVVAVALRPHIYTVEGGRDYEQILPDLGEGYCDVCDAYVPFPIPVEGKYNDYGGIEEIVEGEATQALQELTGKTAQQFFAEASRIEETNRRGEYCQVLILQEVWDALLQIAPEVRESAFGFVVAPAFQKENFEGFGDTKIFRAAKVYLQTLAKWSEEEPRDLDYWDVQRAFEVRLGDLPEARKACRDLVRVSHMLRTLRRGWMPQFGMGGQDAEWEDYLCLTHLTLKILKDRTKAREGGE